MYKCCICDVDYNFEDEVERMNCNGDTEKFDESEIELNAMNTDWCVYFVCDICVPIFDEVKSNVEDSCHLSFIIQVAREISKKYEDNFEELPSEEKQQVVLKFINEMIG